MRAGRAALVVAVPPLVAALFGGPGCRTDDASLPPEPATGGRDAGTGGRDASSGGGAGGTEDDAALPDVTPPPSEPKTFTLLHGLTDSPWIAFCFAKVDGNVEGPLAPELFPAGGLGYGESVAAADLPGDAHLGDDSVRPYVVAAASAQAVRGLDCRAIAALTNPPPAEAGAPDASAEGGAPDPGIPLSDAGLEDGGTRDAGAPPPVPIADIRMAALPVLPAGAFPPDESYLVAVAGCLGGRGVTAPTEASICGASYSPSTPTLATHVVRLSRETSPRAVGLQFLVATPAFGRADLQLVPPLTDAITVVNDVAPGALRPVSPYLDSSSSDIGAGAEGARVQVSASGSSLAAYDAPWQPTLAAGRINALEDGQTYTLVMIGPSPGFDASRWWNGALVTVVKNGD
jgi:hypothetical protein